MIRVINAIKQAVSIPIVPLEAENTGEQVIYNITPISDNGILKANRLQLNIVAKNLAYAEMYDTAIRKAILNIGDSCPVDGINSITVNGGGTLTSEAGVHRIVYYNVIIGG